MRDFFDSLRGKFDSKYAYAVFYIIAVVVIAFLPTISEVIRPAQHTFEANNTITGKHLVLDELAKVEQVDTDELSENFTSDAKIASANYSDGAAVATYASYSQPATGGTTITINGRTLNVTDVARPTCGGSGAWADMGYGVGRHGRFLYGHNYASVFGGIENAGQFTVTENGATKTYTIRGSVTLPKANTEQCGFVDNLINGTVFGGNYTYVLMTCAGELYGNGDASHRTIVFAS